MVDLAGATLVFVAGLITALATGTGALPFLLVAETDDRWNVGLWGLASGIMAAASLFGLVGEGLSTGTVAEVGAGALAGVVLVVLAHAIVEDADVDPREYEAAGVKRLVLVLGVLTVHSFPEGIAISIPLRSMGVSEPRMVWWSVFSSLPRPLGAVVAFAFVRTARAVVPSGYGFAAGAMIYLVAAEFVPEALEVGADLPGGGRRELIGGTAAGVLLMLPLALVEA